MEKKTKQKIKEFRTELKKWEKQKVQALQYDDVYAAQVIQYQIDFCNNCLKELDDLYKKKDKKENAND